MPSRIVAGSCRSPACAAIMSWMMPLCFAPPECVVMAARVGARLRLERRTQRRAPSAPSPRSIVGQHLVRRECAAQPAPHLRPAYADCRGGSAQRASDCGIRAARLHQRPRRPPPRARRGRRRRAGSRRRAARVPAVEQRGPTSSPAASRVRSRLFCRNSNGSTSVRNGFGAGRGARADRQHGRSEQEVALRHRQHARGLADEQLAVGAHLVGLGVDVDRAAVASFRFMSLLADPARVS